MVTKRTPRSTSRRAVRHDCPKVLRPYCSLEASLSSERSKTLPPSPRIRSYACSSHWVKASSRGSPFMTCSSVLSLWSRSRRFRCRWSVTPCATTPSTPNRSRPGPPPRGKGLVAGAQKTGFGKPTLRLGQHDVGWNEPLVSRVVALEQGGHGAGARIYQPVARLPSGLNDVGGRFMGVHVVGHASEDGILVGLLRQQGEQLADEDPVDGGRDRGGPRGGIVVARPPLWVAGVPGGGGAPP